jgi:hypothetical protein
MEISLPEVGIVFYNLSKSTTKYMWERVTCPPGKGVSNEQCIEGIEV